MKTVMEMAREAGLGDAEGWINEEYDYKKEILAFAALVRADERELVLAAAIDGAEHAAREAIADEREACAKVIESHGPFLANGALLVEAIRARGNT